MSGFAGLVEQSGSIRSLDAAAVWRWSEAELLREHGRSAAALYWYGFVAEMRLTAAVLRLRGYFPTDPIALETLREIQAEARRQKLMSSEPHDLSGLARYAVYLREILMRQTPKQLGREVQLVAARVYEQWRPRLRYKPITPNATQLSVARAGAEWLVKHYNALWS